MNSFTLLGFQAIGYYHDFLSPLDPNISFAICHIASDPAPDAW
ncbi:hypothetical protein [Bradyrhizobium arachidis]|nr:hypothetical protein [Bradyrhizobium arachidis]